MVAEDDRHGSTEQTPLLSDGVVKPQPARVFSVVQRLLLCAFLVALSFGVTQVPLIYVFRVMTCDSYYKEHDSPPPGTGKDRCSVPEIESSAAKAVALLGASTMLFGLINLFITGWAIKRIGVKGALTIQVFWPALRLLVQNIGVMTGGNIGIIIVQASQIITIIGGPNGYFLCLTSFITEVTEHEQRTPTLGKLQGAMFFGTSIGYLLGGEISERFGIIWPFRVTLVLFCLCTLYVLVCLPRIPPLEVSKDDPKTQGLKRFFGPFQVFAPHKFLLRNGTTKRQFGPILLASGVYLGILATGYIPILLQMYSTNIFGFGTRQNGLLIAISSLLRGFFLTFIFPKIIAFGRAKMSKQDLSKAKAVEVEETNAPPEATQIEIVDAMDGEQEPLQSPQPRSKQETFDFDLVYARYSLLLDGILTGAASFIQQGWQIYLVAVALPFAAGTGSASKGSILQMCSASERTDALSAITLVENMARLTTTSIFGLIYAAFAQIEKTYLVFTINGAVALLGFAVLLFAAFPPPGSERLEDSATEE